MEEGQLDDVWPDGRAGTTADPAGGGGHKPNTAGVSRADVHGVTCEGLMFNPPDELQLRQLLVGLEYGPLGEQFSQDAPVAQKRGAQG